MVYKVVTFRCLYCTKSFENKKDAKVHLIKTHRLTLKNALAKGNK